MAAPITSRTNGHNLVLLIQARFLHQFNRVPCLKFFLLSPSGPAMISLLKWTDDKKNGGVSINPKEISIQKYKKLLMDTVKMHIKFLARAVQHLQLSLIAMSSMTFHLSYRAH